MALLLSKDTGLRTPAAEGASMPPLAIDVQCDQKAGFYMASTLTMFAIIAAFEIADGAPNQYKLWLHKMAFPKNIYLLTNFHLYPTLPHHQNNCRVFFPEARHVAVFFSERRSWAWPSR